ncbi:MAG TPA: NAD(P)-binding domain-containing protein, partial [Niastella sp.]|nr:NAD(P)-binding domain-containing protein [Niastella sp.]
MRVVIIGTGNVATILGKRFLAADHEIVQVCGRNALYAEDLADTLSASSTTDLKNIDQSADLYVMAVSDAAVAAVAAALQLNNKFIVHTAGAVSKDVLSACSR